MNILNTCPNCNHAVAVHNEVGCHAAACSCPLHREAVIRSIAVAAAIIWSRGE